ncbi:terminase [Wolbachia endosymbiont of Drosophila mauritiana]|uniref:phage terminase large subunit n=1 Tax=unclassified Wolbachia TaxID=2640676 RepID=UPI00107EA6D6|nr:MULTISPECIES: phage terminase large subunit [unclassified Wolbachia]QCB62223.1 terminase [Wolbachia endosymbiont of Drosophila mauritiana]QCB63270.1 terminase [Wolbachia endosymbiont of Drosophila mauritiana]QWE33467.1 Putative phage terminase [Wolbachia endosymbiont of Drosophila simulans]TGB07733.1 terminase [Wolbachia endosymbiont of Drosophila mauritiana]
MNNINLLKFIELCFQTVVPGCEYNDYQYIKVIADRLEAASAGKVKRIIFNMPPRSMKSICVSVAWPAWILGNQPTARIIVASYSRLLSEKHSLDTRCIMQSDWYRELFPKVELCKDQNTKYKFQTVQRGCRIATSVGGTLTGEGGDFIIVDDPLSPAQALSETFRKRAANWFDQALVTRLNDRKKGVIVLVMQRLHLEDLTGHLLCKPRNIWHHVRLPIIAEDKEIIYSVNNHIPEHEQEIYSRKEGQLLYSLTEGKEEIEMIKAEFGSYGFAAQYQQNPLPLSSAIIKREWLKRYKNFPDSLLHVTQSWDTAISTNNTSDFSVCTTWTKVDNTFYLLDVYRAKLEYPKLKEKVLSLAARWKPHAILIEAKASGQQLVQELRKNSDLPIIQIVPHDDKLTRFHRIVPIIESERVFLPNQAVWLSDFEYEILMFPEIRHDDQVDSTVQYLQWVRNNIARVVAIRSL